MKRKPHLYRILAVLVILLALCASPFGVQASTPDPLLGIWYVNWETIPPAPAYSGMAHFEIFTIGSDYYATVYVPQFYVFYETWPVYIVEDTINVGILSGTLSGDVIQGVQLLPDPYNFPISWKAVKGSPQSILLDPGPGPECGNLPPLYCTGTAEYCSELVRFDPTETAGYIDYPENGETWENQYRSYLRRDLMQLISYATAKLQCKTSGWDFGSDNPLGLIDMSEANGSIPGTSIGQPGHPWGSHQNGSDIDVSYYQIYTPDNRAREVCDHYELDDSGFYQDVYHCTSQPYLLDSWRTALFIGFLNEHPHLRVIGVDGKAGPILESNLDLLAQKDWIDPESRVAIPLIFEETDLGMGWYQFHHHHMHVSIQPVQSILLSLTLEPDTFNLKSAGQYVTAYIELVEGYDPGDIDQQTIFISAAGDSIVYANMEKRDIGDYNQNGIPDLMVKFDREAFQEILSTGWVEITLYGTIDGDFFQGVDSIFVN